MRKLIWSVAVILLTNACASHGPAVPSPFPRPARKTDLPTVLTAPGQLDAHAITATALDLRGVPFATGGASPTGFDCSGFTSYVFRRHGVALPRQAAAQYGVGHPVDRDAIEPGDLLFFTTIAPGASHVALATGTDEFVHAPSTRGYVRVERLSSDYWSGRFLGARRIIGATR